MLVTGTYAGPGMVKGSYKIELTSLEGEVLGEWLFQGSESMARSQKHWKVELQDQFCYPTAGPFIDRTKEYIMCAAIWYKDFPDAVHMPKGIDKGVVVSGANHAQIIQIVKSLSGKRQAESGEYESGFVTSCNRYVDRKEALKIAISQNQLNEHYAGQDQLYSEYILTY